MQNRERTFAEYALGGRYRRLRANELIFLFAYDADAPELLHIYARHLTTETDALRVFLTPSVRTSGTRRVSAGGLEALRICSSGSGASPMR